MGLRARLLSLVAIATLLPALLLGWRFVRERDAEIAVSIETLSEAARASADELEHRVQGTAQLHFGLAHSGVLESGDRAACSAYLAQVLDTYPQYTGLLTALPDGQMQCDSLASGRTLDLRERAYFKRVMAGEKGIVLDPVFGLLTGKAILQIVYPVRDDGGRLRFMLLASLGLQRFLQEALAHSRLAHSALLLLDEQGRVMATAGAMDGLPMAGASSFANGLIEEAKKRAVFEVASPQGRAQVWAVASSPSMRTIGLRVLVGQPMESLTALAPFKLRQGAAALLGASLLLFAGVWWLAERGLRLPVLRVTQTLTALGSGRLDARIALPHPSGEMGELMSVVNRTADSLEQQQQDNLDLTQQLQAAHRREIREREANEDRLSRMANFDGLTGLPNRTLFHDRLQHALQGRRGSGRPFALMFLDIDRFKNINDSLGHDIGDRLLLEVSRVLAGCMRRTDTLGRDEAVAAPEGVFRLGGDEFMVLVEDVASSEDVAAIAERLLAALGQPIRIAQHTLYISASIGITVCADDHSELDTLVKQADLAMYRAKAMGRETYCFFDETMNQAAALRHQLEVQLRQALERGEFLLHFQPKCQIATGRVTGVEALLRWQPEGGPMVPPDQFICVLEETGLILPVGDWVLREACAQMMAWQQRGMRPLKLAVNLSARQFRHQNLVRQVDDALAQTGFDPERLELELTESMLVDDIDDAERVLAELSARGVSVAIDDFGTGHSSLRYLKRFNVDTLKIDRSFVKDTPDDPEDSAISTAVIALGHSLGLQVVAEGVETEAQADFLRSRACDELQGYLLSRPLAPKAFETWMAQREGAAAVLPMA
jgi:diguanylate cyclase (GGDEF)-like protein